MPRLSVQQAFYTCCACALETGRSSLVIVYRPVVRALPLTLDCRPQVLSQEVHRLQQALRGEADRLDAARQELAAVQAER